MFDNLTKSDIEKMQEEIEYRKLVVRKEALEAVKEARAHGDLSENFEYKAAKQDKNRNESRIRYLEKMIKTARIISDESKEDEVGLGDRVELYIPEDDETETYKLVTTVRGNSLKGLISIDSPLGKAIRGHRVGERVYIKVNSDFGYEAEIRAIDKTAEAEEDTLRSFSSADGRIYRGEMRYERRGTVKDTYDGKNFCRVQWEIPSRRHSPFRACPAVVFDPAVLSRQRHQPGGTP